jgi:hypothetical protein
MCWTALLSQTGAIFRRRVVLIRFLTLDAYCSSGIRGREQSVLATFACSGSSHSQHTISLQQPVRAIPWACAYECRLLDTSQCLQLAHT